MSAATGIGTIRGTLSRRGTQASAALSLPGGMSKKRADDRWFKRSGGTTQYEVNEKGRTVEFATTSNKVITSKYTIISFLPLNLWEQFLNLANIYFLCVGILQIVPQISTTGGDPTQYQPLAFIVFVSALRAAKEDYDKHVADNKRNGFRYMVARPMGMQNIESGDIRVGDIVQVKQNEMIPADMLFLSSALPKGHCFIDKSNLNGETTLEVMNSIPMTRDVCRSDESVIKFQCQLVYEAPNKRFDSFRGNMWIENEKTRTEISVDGKALLMRETNLRNCEYLYGLVVYTGNDTKIQRSNLEGEKSHIKESRIMKQVGVFLQYMLLALCGMCVIGGILAGAYCNSEGLQTNNAWYLALQDGDNAYSCPLTGFLAFFSWVILLSQMVPISLIVSAELVKFAQSIFIGWDITMYHEGINKPAKCNSSTIHEDLGLVDYIFSDKTGTLTQNKMEFRYIAVPSGEYGSKETDIAKSVKARQAELEEKMRGGGAKPQTAVKWSKFSKAYEVSVSPKERETKCCLWWPWFAENCWQGLREEDGDKDADEVPANVNTFTNEEKAALLRGLWGPPYPSETPEETAQRKADIRLYMTHMALSNTVKPFEEKGEMKFQAESAEELAMSNFARSCGFFKKSINPTVLEVMEYSPDLKQVNLVVETYNHVATFGFTSKRARVTVIYQRVGGPNDGSILVMTKGQDTVILPLVKVAANIEDNLLLNLKDMSTNGLRTLVSAHSDKPAQWWNSYAHKYAEVIGRDTTSASDGHPEKCNKQLCEKCAQHDFFENMEKDANLRYIGCIGLEDQLQLLVPACIADFMKAGIQVAMITGDKLETAKNIGIACNLIDPDMLPQLKQSETMDQIVEEYQNSRLIEITGQWADLAEDKEQIGRLFDTFDTQQSGTLTLSELSFILKSLRCTIPQQKLREFLEFDSKQNAAPTGVQAPLSVTRVQFINIMQSSRISKFEAVKYDIDQGIETYNRIEDHVMYPVSILIDRSAWQVLFPGKPAHKDKAANKSKSDLNSKVPKHVGDSPIPLPSSPSTVGLPTSPTFSGGVYAPDYQPTEEELEDLRSKFFKLMDRSKSVVFARAEPAMKKRMVTEVQSRVPSAITLAVGDGANDQDMIMAAHVGVGIAGVEGTAATNSADYAIGTFRYLHTLLFVHGFYSYQRVARLVNFIFYKASLCALTMFLFGFFSAFSGQQFFDDPPYQLYNVMYTALPILCVAILDKPLPQQVLQDNPILYKKSKNTAFTGAVFSSWVFRSALHTVIMFFICYAEVGVNNVNSQTGRSEGIWFWAITNYYSVVLCPTFMILFEMNSISFLAFLSIFISILCLYVVTLIINVLLSIDPNLYGVVYELYASGSAWFTIILAVAICLLLELIYRGYQREFSPFIWQVFQEKVKSSGTQGDLSAVDEVPNGPLVTQGSKRHLPIVTGAETRENSIASKDTKFSHLRLNLVRAMLRFRNMTGASFDSAAQTHLQSHDQFKDQDGKVYAAINAQSPDIKIKNILSHQVVEEGEWRDAMVDDGVFAVGPATASPTSTVGVSFWDDGQREQKADSIPLSSSAPNSVRMDEVKHTQG